MSGEYEVACPHDGCEEALHVVWTMCYTLSPDGMTQDVPVPSECHTEGWKVECSAGHVVLLPDYNWCCDDPEGPDCPHNPDDFDTSPEESATFRNRDMARLRDVIARLGGAS